MSTCNKCHRKIKATAKFCVYCGTKRNINRNYSENRPSQKRQTQQQRIVPKKSVPQRNIPQYNVPRKNVPQKVVPHRNIPKKNMQIEFTQNISSQKNIFSDDKHDFNQNINEQKNMRSQHNVRTSAQMKTSTRIKTKQKEIKPKNEELYQLDLRMERTINTVNRAINSYNTRDEFTRSDATQLNNYIKELKNYTTNHIFNDGKFSKECTDLIEKSEFLAIKIFESLTYEIKNEQLKELKNEWSVYREKIKKRIQTKSLLDKLEIQNKKINIKIDKFEKIFGKPSYTSYHKSKLFTKFKNMRTYYLNELGPAIEEYLSVLNSSDFKNYFEDEANILNKIREIADPNIPNKESISTHQISKLCFDFIEERGINAATLRLQLQELEDQLIKNDKKIKEIQRRYFNKMWNLINSEQLGVTSINPGKMDYSPTMEHVTQKEELKENLDNLKPLNKLKPLKSLANFE